MPLSQLAVPLTRDQAQALVDAVMERGDLAVSAAAHEDETTGEWVFEATCDGPPDLDSFSDLARLTLGGDVQFSLSRLDPDTDWVARSLEGLHPVAAGGFWVHGSHADTRPPAGLTPILIDAAQAFGTGHHDTTAGCLEAIEAVLKRRRPRAMLDVGTGSGVLAIALAKRLRQPVIASDIDPVAVRIAAGNARLNHAAPFLRPVVATGLAHRVIAANAPYDVIVANILATPLARLAPAIARAAAPGAAVILSGLLATQAPRVLAAYRTQGVVLRRRIVRREWATLILEKAHTGKP